MRLRKGDRKRMRDGEVIPYCVECGRDFITSKDEFYQYIEDMFSGKPRRPITTRCPTPIGATSHGKTIYAFYGDEEDLICRDCWDEMVLKNENGE